MRPHVTPPEPLGLLSPPDPMLVRQLGEYKLLEKLGEGGMGAVYKARHTKLNRDVALKILPKDREDDAGAIARFEREMQACGALEHPNIVVTHDAREIDGRRFLVMELLDGLDLEQVIRRCPPLDVADACELIRQAALGLQYAHEHGLVHRDIKPSNLMLTGQRQVKILDLGLAKLRMGGRQGEEMTGTNAALGTLQYMAPEQICETRTADVRADIYSLGCTLYKLLVGHAPFSFPPDVPKYEIMRGHMERSPPALGRFRADVPAEVAAVVNRMLAKEPARRFQTPVEVADALGPFAAGADLAALLDCAGHTPPTALSSSPHTETPSSLFSSATRLNSIIAEIQEDPVVPPRKRAKEARKPPEKRPAPYTALVWGLGGIAAILLVALALVASGHRGDKRLAKAGSGAAQNGQRLPILPLPGNRRLSNLSFYRKRQHLAHLPLPRSPPTASSW